MKASLVLRYILEGRLNYNNFNQALMQSTGMDLYDGNAAFNTGICPVNTCERYGN